MNENFDYITYISGFTSALEEVANQYEYRYKTEISNPEIATKKARDILINILNEQRILAAQKLGKVSGDRYSLYKY